jgi:hypothetical protein
LRSSVLNLGWPQRLARYPKVCMPLVRAWLLQLGAVHSLDDGAPGRTAGKYDTSVGGREQLRIRRPINQVIPASGSGSKFFGPTRPNALGFADGGTSPRGTGISALAPQAAPIPGAGAPIKSGGQYCQCLQAWWCYRIRSNDIDASQVSSGGISVLHQVQSGGSTVVELGFLVRSEIISVSSQYCQCCKAWGAASAAGSVSNDVGAAGSATDDLLNRGK